MESDSPLSRTVTVCKDRDVLRPDYQPEEVVEREAEVEQYAELLNPILNGWSPDNAFICGNSGTGKTVTTQYMLDHLRNDVRESDVNVDLNIIEINCDGHDSSYRVAVEIVNKLRDSSNQISKTGHPRSVVYDWMWEELNELGGMIIIILDEVDHIGQDDSILYQLTRGDSIGELTDARLSLIGISNDSKYTEKLSSKVRGTLCDKQIDFSAYDAGELQTIIEQRAEVALYEDAYDEEVISLIAALGAKKKGSARRAVDILRNAVDKAIGEGADQITTDHVRKADKEVERGRLKDVVRTLSPHGEHVLKAVTEMANRDELPAKSKEIYPSYKRVCNQVGTDPLTIRSVREHLSDLDMLGILNHEMKNEGLKSGSYALYQLADPVGDAVEYFNDQEIYTDISDPR